jgi:hypothetical protein
MSDTRRQSASTKSKSQESLLYSTTEGRQRFPDLLQISYGNKAVIGFDRYGRALGAVVPMEAVRMLAGFGDSVDEDVRKRIERTARLLIEQLPDEAELCGLPREAEEEPGLAEIEDVEAARRQVPKGRKSARVGK